MPGAFMHGQRGDIFSVEFYDPSVGLDDANDHVKTSGFARAIGAQEADHLTAVDLQGNIPHHFPTTVGFGQIICL
jgi:hypothetical protein